MSKGKPVSEATVRRWIARGDGQGEGVNYHPFFKVLDVPSCGRSHIFPGLKTSRNHVYFTDLEYAAHIWAEYSRGVVDIREQYALLPREETQEIAKELKIKHSIYPYTNIPIVMTSDLVLTRKQRNSQSGDSSQIFQGEYCVVCVKPSYLVFSDHRLSSRISKKITIEKIFWSCRSASFNLCTEWDIPWNKVRNLDNYCTWLLAQELDEFSNYFQIFPEIFLYYWAADRSLNKIISFVADDLGLDINHCFLLFGRSLWLRLLPVDLDSELILHEFPVKLTLPPNRFRGGRNDKH